MPDLVNILVWILLFCCFAWALSWICGRFFPEFPPARWICGLILLIVLIYFAMGQGPHLELPKFPK